MRGILFSILYIALVYAYSVYYVNTADWTTYYRKHVEDVEGTYTIDAFHIKRYSLYSLLYI